jgi:hypothetical protein
MSAFGGQAGNDQIAKHKSQMKSQSQHEKTYWIQGPQDCSATAVPLSAKGGIDDGRCTTHTGLDGNGLGRAILGAGAAFHAGVFLFNLCVSVVHGQDGMGTDHEAHSASNTFFLIKLQCNHILQID